MAVKKSGLGRGIGAIFEENGAMLPEEETKGVVKELRISEVEPNKAQPRKNFDEEALKELAASISEHGVISPIIVRPLDSGRYQIIAGERRWRASKIAGKSIIPALVVTYDDRTATEISLIENLQREDLNPIEESEGYLLLQQTYDLSQEEISARVGKSRSAVANALRLLALPKEVLDMLKEGKLSAGHARAILSCKTEKGMITLAQKTVTEGLSVRAVEKLAKIWELEVPQKVKPTNYIIDELNRQLSSRLSRKVNVKSNGKKGTLEISFYDNDDLNTLLTQLGLEIDM